ncbi:hypothetical protein N9D29_04875 [Flavobacteriaceae bacterium]|nr:hypothetical protein [Flavobacteriaceae bacterium]
MKKLLLLSALFIFSCSDDEGNPCVYEPTLTTEAVTDITETSATLNGVISIVSENCDVPNNTEQGFVYSTEIQPTLEDTQVNVNGTNISTTIEGLTPNTTYYVRAFLTNNLGDFYGDEVNFTTAEEVDFCLVEEVVDLHIDVNCYGNNTGSFTIEISGCNSPPYNLIVVESNTGVVLLDSFSQNNIYTIDNLSSGIYDVFVEDSNGNEYVTDITINESGELQIVGEVSDYNGYSISCFGANDGNINLTLTGGAPPYAYQWNSGGLIFDAGYLTNSPSEFTLNNIVTGLWELTIEDSNGCILQEVYELFAPEELTISNDYVFDLPSFAVYGGVPPFTYELFIDNVTYASGTSTDFINNNYVYDPSFLGNGTYIFIVTDANGCVSEQLEIIE